jgi:predicted N-acetyltransferase YhbS
MNIKLRRATPDEVQRCGTICYEAFTAIANQHNFPPDLPSAEVTIGLLSKLIADPRFYAIVAEIDHQVVGSNFMDERSAIAGIGPITIDPTVQNRGIGRLHGASCSPAFASFKPVITSAPSLCTRSWDSSRASHSR